VAVAASVSMLNFFCLSLLLTGELVWRVLKQADGWVRILMLSILFVRIHVRSATMTALDACAGGGDVLASSDDEHRVCWSEAALAHCRRENRRANDLRALGGSARPTSGYVLVGSCRPPLGSR